ncbi:MAG: hypothetical protein R3C02_05400 [Planctomycetaceae bacterium]
MVSLANGDPLQSAAIGAAQMARLQVLPDDPKNALDHFAESLGISGHWPQRSVNSPVGEIREVNDNSNLAEQRVKRDMRLPAGMCSPAPTGNTAEMSAMSEMCNHQTARSRSGPAREANSRGLLDNVTEVIREPGLQSS